MFPCTCVPVPVCAKCPAAATVHTRDCCWLREVGEPESQVLRAASFGIRRRTGSVSGFRGGRRGGMMEKHFFVGEMDDDGGGDDGVVMVMIMTVVVVNMMMVIMIVIIKVTNQ